jgi:LVIVD repeat
VSDPAHPRGAGSLPARGLTTARELRALPAKKLLIVLSFTLGRGGVNRMDLYRWTDDCARPSAVGGYDFGGRSPHEFFLWQDPGGARTLLFVSMFSGGGGDLQVLDVTDPGAPRLAGTWASPVGLLHSISLSADGRRAFLSMWTGGLLVGDVSQFTTGQTNPQLTLLTPVGARLPAPAGGNVHSAVQVPGRDLLVVTDERYPPACPYGPARLVDVSNPAQPRAVSALAAPENDPTTCRSSPVGTYTSHNPTLTADLALISWYSSGLQVFDISDPANPQRLVEFRPQASQPGQRDPQLGATLPLTWSYPIVRDGLIYVADIDEGLYVLRYGGPHQEQLDQLAFAEGNSNLTALRPASPSPPPSPSAVAALPSAPAVTATPGSKPAAAVSPAVVVGGGLLVLGLLAAVGLLAWRRPGAGPR